MARPGLVPLFVDTSLHTHLAIAVSPNDTVASVKRKFASEHGLCFPEVGRIDIEALITRWQGKEYRLSETMSIPVVLQMEGGCFLKALVATQLQPHTEITTLKKKRKRNIASFEDTTTITTTLRPTESSRGGGEEFQVTGHGENRPSNDSYCDAKKGESRKAERNDASIAVCEAEYIKEAPLCLEKAKDIFRKKSRHDSKSPEIPEGPAKKKAKNDDANKKVVRKDGDIIKKDGSLLEVTQTIDTVVLTEKKKKQRDRTKTKGPCSDLPSEVKHKPQVEDRNQVHPDIDTDNQPVVCFAGPTEVVNTSLKKKCKRNASSEDPTTLRLTPTQSRKGGEEEFQGHGENKQLNDSYCDAKKGKSRKAETNEAEYIKEAPLFLAKEKDISGNNSRHDSESPEIIKHKPQVEEDRNQVSLSHKEKTEKPGEKDTWSGSHEGGNTKKKREGDKKDIMSSCHEYNPKEAAITEMAAEVQLEAASSTYSNNVVLCKELLPPCKKNLLVLDINGILVDITSDYNYQQYPDFKLSGKLGFKRPFCVDFLKFCFANFEVGVWSSRKQYNLAEAVHHLFGEMKNKLLFCWDQSKCTDTKFETVEKKPLFFKELNKLWEKVEANLPWEKGRFTPSNTLLVDDSPCKALRNPPYTAIFPYPYTFYKKEDNSLGRGGEMRIYLEKVAAVENIPEFVKENPFGQSAITPHQHPQWNYYYGILEALKRLAPAF
ncbi:uncharacterized protein LOC144572702 isoform X3 [Carex rostrata]